MMLNSALTKRHDDADAADAGVECDCNDRGTTSLVCDETSGDCLCQDSFTGPTCDRCATGFYRFPHCRRTYVPPSLCLSVCPSVCLSVCLCVRLSNGVLCV